MGSKIREDFVGVTHVYGDGGDTIVLAAGDKVPDGYVVGDHLIEASSEDETDPSKPETPAGPPPRSGKGSGLEAWTAHAESVGVAIEADWSREDIIAAVDAATTAN